MRRNGEPLAHADDEEARARLRREQCAIDDEGAEGVAAAMEMRQKRAKIRAAMRGERALDILQRDEVRRAILGDQALHQGPEGEKTSAPRAFEASAGAGERQILARKRGPGEVCARARQIARRERGDIGGDKLGGAPIGAIGGALPRIEIIGEEAGPARPKSRAYHAAAGEEFVKAAQSLPRPAAQANAARRHYRGAPAR